MIDVSAHGVERATLHHSERGSAVTFHTYGSQMTLFFEADERTKAQKIADIVNGVGK